jgi:hypothetical protein
VILIPLLLAATLTLPEDRGREIYLHGRSSRGAITAVVSEGSVEVPAAVMPCGSCHGANGRGKSEGGVTPARIDWETLTRDLDDGERHRPRYTEALLRRAITMGIDSGAKKLQSVMPRYRLQRDDLDDLVAYLKKLGSIQPPGVHEDIVRIGVAARDLAPLQKYAGKLRVYDRRVVFESADRIDDEKDFFAYIDVLDANSDVPQIVATQSSPTPRLGGSQFALFAGVAQQASALVRVAATRLAPEQRTLAIVYRDATWRDTAEELRSLAMTNGWTSATIGPSTGDAHAILLLEPTATPSDRLLLLPAAIADPSAFDERGQPRRNVVLALPADAVENSAATFAERSVSLAASLVAEALTRSGRELTRESFIAALESIHDFGPAVLSFSRAHHTGAKDVNVVWRGESGTETRRVSP